MIVLSVYSTVRLWHPRLHCVLMIVSARFVVNRMDIALLLLLLLLQLQLLMNAAATASAHGLQRLLRLNTIDVLQWALQRNPTRLVKFTLLRLANVLSNDFLVTYQLANTLEQKTGNHGGQNQAEHHNDNGQIARITRYFFLQSAKKYNRH